MKKLLAILAASVFVCSAFAVEASEMGASAPEATQAKAEAHMKAASAGASTKHHHGHKAQAASASM